MENVRVIEGEDDDDRGLSAVNADRELSLSTSVTQEDLVHVQTHETQDHKTVEQITISRHQGISELHNQEEIVSASATSGLTSANVLGSLRSSLGWLSWTSNESGQDSASGTPISNSGS